MLYLEYLSICPFVRIGSPQRVCLPTPWNQKGGGATLAYMGGDGGANSDDWGESLELCLPCDPNIQHIDRHGMHYAMHLIDYRETLHAS